MVLKDDSSLRQPRGAGLIARPPARQARLADQLYEQILEQIVSGRLPEGARLPSEKELCRLFEVSRPIVREALLRLNVDGLVVSRRGSGTYVRRRPAPNFMDLVGGSNVADLFRCWELRIPVECEATYFAAQRRTAADLAAIRQTLEEFKGLFDTSAVGNEADLRFHRAVAAASGNDLFVSILESLRDSIDKGMKLAHKLSWADNHVRLKKIFAEHVQVFDAIAASDAEGARDSMRNHIENARERILGTRRPPSLTGG